LERFQFLSNPVCEDQVGFRDEFFEIGDHGVPVEVGPLDRGLVDNDLDSFGAQARHDVLDGGGAEVVAVGLHGEAVDTHRRILFALEPLHHLGYNELFSRPVALHDRGDEVLGHALIVGPKLLGVFGQTVSSIAERGVVVALADPRVEADAVDDALRVEPLDLGVGVEFVEIRDP